MRIGLCDAMSVGSTGFMRWSSSCTVGICNDSIHLSFHRKSCVKQICSHVVPREQECLSELRRGEHTDNECPRREQVLDPSRPDCCCVQWLKKRSLNIHVKPPDRAMKFGSLARIRFTECVKLYHYSKSSTEGYREPTPRQHTPFPGRRQM
jgi:hypothetical protein